MSTRSKTGLALLFAGLVLLFGAFGLWQHNREDDLEAESNARVVMEELAPLIMERAEVAVAAPDIPTETEIISDSNITETPVREMDTVEIDGKLYIGFLTVPDLELELPVMSTWNYDLLTIAPCRYHGTVEGRDLVIAAHNYSRHFGKLRNLTAGESILFTDVNGRTTGYTVEALEVLQPDAVEEMTAGEYPLSLFTCTYGGATRFTVRCVLD